MGIRGRMGRRRRSACRSRRMNRLRTGSIQALLTRALSEKVAAVHEAGGEFAVESLDPADSHELLAQHLYGAIRAHLRALSGDDRIAAQAALSNLLIELLRSGRSYALISRNFCS